MNGFISEIYDNLKIIIKESTYYTFIKVFIIFLIYLLSNYIFDRINHEDLIRPFHSKPYINLKLPTNTMFELILIILMIIVSHYVYKVIKPYVYPKD